MTTDEAADWRAGLERLQGAFADRTLAAYTHHFQRFERWCRGAERVSLPASAETVAAYLDASFAQGFTPMTIVAQMHAIRRVHRVMHLADPTAADDVWIAIRRGRRAAAPPRQALPINAALKDQLVAACPPTLMGLRDRALIHLGYDMLARRSELLALQVEDLERLGEGTARIRIRTGKLDPGRAGDHGYLSAAGLEALQAWLTAARVTEGHIFRTVRREKAGGPVRQTSLLNARLATVAVAAGFARKDAVCLTGHSLRVGAAQDLALAGRSILEIMRAGRWRNPHIVAQYVQKAPVHVWHGREGDIFPLAVQAESWRRRRIAARAAGLDEAALDLPLRG